MSRSEHNAALGGLERVIRETTRQVWRIYRSALTADGIEIAEDELKLLFLLAGGPSHEEIVISSLTLFVNDPSATLERAVESEVVVIGADDRLCRAGTHGERLLKSLLPTIAQFNETWRSEFDASFGKQARSTLLAGLTGAPRPSASNGRSSAGQTFPSQEHEHGFQRSTEKTGRTGPFPERKTSQSL